MPSTQFTSRFIVLFSLFWSHVKPFSCPWYHSDATRFNHEHPNWMKTIPNSVHLSDLSIPGTHDTVALYGGGLAETQSLKLEDQLHAGVRALDIRLRHVSDRFAINHGVVWQRTYFEDVLETCNRFLDKHPSEVIVMFLQKEHTDGRNSRRFEDTFMWYRDSTQYGSRLWDGMHVPRVGEVRGKIVIIDRLPGQTSFGIPRGNVIEQNQWRVPTLFHITKKQDLIKDHFALTKLHKTFYANWLTGTGSGAHPYSIARRINYFAYSYIKSEYDNNKGNDCCRILMLDFPGQELIHFIVMLNPHSSRSQCKNRA